MSDRHLPAGTTAHLAGHCVGRVAQLLARRQLHLDRHRVGKVVETADRRRFVIYRESSSSEPCDGEPVTLAMWFHLRGVPPGASFRAFLFERESILNTALYAGFEGYRTKLWTVDHATNDYAGFYTWRGREAAERYAEYAMTMLDPISVPGSLGCDIVDGPEPTTWRVLEDRPTERPTEDQRRGRPTTVIGELSRDEPDLLRP